MSTNILPFDGEVFYYSGVINEIESGKLFQRIKGSTPWKQNSVRMFGKYIPEPRLTAFYGDPDKKYTYSGLQLAPSDWTDDLLNLKSMAEELTSEVFNVVLLNYYRNGQDSMGWHRDNEKELGREPVIASFSLGCSRKFQLRNYFDKKHKISLLLEPGSLLIMQGKSQHCWEHSVPKCADNNERINLTFRHLH